MTTFVIADIHGNLQLLENFFIHSKYDKNKDTLIHAGDMCDIGNETLEVMHRLEKENAIILIGNHEFAHCYGQFITPYDYSLDKTPIVDYWRDKILSKEWGVAHAISDVIITHAGISQALYNHLYLDKSTTVDAIADKLNFVLWSFSGRSRGILELLTNKWLGYDDMLSPLWFRPYDLSYIQDNEVIIGYPAQTLKQVAGHTPLEYYRDNLPKIEELLKKDNFTMIDPYSRRFKDSGYTVYAIIHDNNTVERIQYSNVSKE